MKRALLLALLMPMLAFAQGPQRAVAMHGVPKYAAVIEAGDFSHFDYVNPHAPPGGTLRLNMVGSFDSLNPYIVRGLPAAGLGTGGMALLNQSLLFRSQDEPFSLYGLIAEKIDMPADRSRITFFINPAARWHDGAPITARDVYFSWQTLRDQGRPNHRSYYSKVAKAVVADDRTITFFFKPLAGGGYDRELPLIMGLMPVLPKHYWAGRAFNATTLQPPLGSGPYKIASVDAGRSIVFEKVKNHWAKDLPVQRGMYYFDAIRIDYFRDENVATEAMLAGRYDLRREADAARWATGYPPHVLEKSGLMKNMLPHGRVVPFRGFVLNTRRDMFSDRRVRMALGSVLDFGWLNKNIWYGTQKRTTSIFDNSPLKAPPTLSAASMALAKKLGITLPHDEQNPPTIPETMTRVALREKLKAADALLHQAGYNLKNGQRITPQGKPFIFDIVLNDPADEKIALSWAQQLKILGIFPTIRTMDSAQYQQALNQFNYDVVVAQWINSHSPGNEQMVYWGSAAASQPGSRNYAGVNDARVDKIAAAIPATETREDLVAAAQLLDRLIMAGYYVVPFGFAPADLLLHHKNLRFPEKIPLYGYIIESLWWQENMLQTPKTATQSAPTPANSK